MYEWKCLIINPNFNQTLFRIVDMIIVINLEDWYL